MTSRPTEIQALIAEIDNLLANSGQRSSSSLFSKGNNPGRNSDSIPRQLLERVRAVLVDGNQNHGDPNQIAAPLNLHGENLPSQLVAGDNQVREVTAPLREEIQALLAERKQLVEEIRELEQRRLQNHSLAQQVANQEETIAEFLKVLINRVETQLPSTSNQAIARDVIPSLPPSNSIQNVFVDHSSDGTQVSDEVPSRDNTYHESEHLARLTQELDRRLLALDGTVNVVFDALQRNIQTYYESLTQNLSKMHSTSAQGEEVLINLINNLTSTLESYPQNLKNQPNEGEAIQHSTPTRIIQPVNKSNPAQTPTETAKTTKNEDEPNLDKLLLELSRDLDTTPASGSSAPKTSASASGNNAIDALYAGLFSNDSLDSSPQPNTPDHVSQLLADDTNVEGIDDIQAILASQEQEPVNVESSIDAIENIDNSLDVDIDNQGAVSPQPNQTDSRESIGQVPLTSPELTADIPGSSGNIETNTNSDRPISQSAQDLYPAVSLDPSLVVNITPPSPSTQNSEPTSATKFVVDPWFDGADGGLLGSGSADGTQVKTSTPPANDISVNIQPEPTIDRQPPQPSDTITALTDLKIDGEQREELKITDSLTAEITTETSIPTVPTPPAATNQAKTSSPRENLIAQATANLDLDGIIPEISLDLEQQAQLHADLTRFEAQPAIPLPVEQLQTQPEELVPNAPTPQSQTFKAGDTQITPLPEPEIISISESNDDIQGSSSPSETTVWYLGIDIGTTGISATLLNRTSTEIYPIYWSADRDMVTSKRTFRLPAEVYLPTPDGDKKNQAPTTQFTAQLKPYLQVALPYRNEQNTWEPTLKLNEAASVPLAWIVRSLSKLFLTLKADKQSTTIGLTASAVGLSSNAFTQIIDNLSGVICNCPANWSEQYRFNIREALSIAKLISHPQEVFFVEEAIASLICELDGANGEEIYTHASEGIKPTRNLETPILGNTLSINLGASNTEMALVDVPENLLELAHSDFMLHSFAYGGKGIEQDIICQLLLPDKWRQSRLDKNSQSDTINSTSWHWQPTISGLEQTRLSSIKWEEISLPHPGEPDLNQRIELQKRLETYPLGQSLLDVASAIKFILQHQETFTFELADQRWLLSRRDLESQVFVPFVRRLNRELNRLLMARSIPTEAIDQIVLNGGVANLTAVNRWLRQKLPNAKMIQNPYLDEDNSPECSRVAYGVSLLPLHPQILDIPRQQYTDYFLFNELLRLLPENPIPFGEIISRLESSGINTRNCQQRILAFLEGEFPAGFLPSSIDSLWLTHGSLESSEYRSITAKPLFEKQGSLSYSPNLQQVQIVRQYLEKIQNSSQQSLTEPYTVNFAIGVPIEEN